MTTYVKDDPIHSNTIRVANDIVSLLSHSNSYSSGKQIRAILIDIISDAILEADRKAKLLK